MSDLGAVEAIKQEARKKIAEEKAAFDKRPAAPHTGWDFAIQMFPRIPFPWEVLPGDIADSLQQLGRACATSPYALPGAAFCLMGSIMGRTLAVSPKDSWDAPLIIWHLDIRESGEGKTPPVRLMAATHPRSAKERREPLPGRNGDLQPVVPKGRRTSNHPLHLPEGTL